MATIPASRDEHYQKGNCVSRGFFTQYLGFGWKVFSAGGGGIWGSRWGAAFSAIGGGFSGDFEVQPGTPVPSALDSPSLPTTEGMPPRGSPAFRGMMGIVVQGKLGELIQDVSRLPRFAPVQGRGGMGLGGGGLGDGLGDI